MDTQTTATLPETISIENVTAEVDQDQLTSSILTGLHAIPKRICSKYFYDAAGSELFEQITALPEYYITRTERQILRQVAHEISPQLRDISIVELGSGDCSKISILLDAIPAGQLKNIKYVPVDVSEQAIKKSANTLSQAYQGVSIRGIVADFLDQLDCVPTSENNLFCFFGSTIGNLPPKHAVRFLSGIAQIMLPGDSFLLGIDRVKTRSVLETAYNDSRNITAAFNKNILKVINNLIGTDFDPEAFEHVAFFNTKKSRIEMHLKAVKNMVISNSHENEKIYVTRDEMIHTENSYKFTREYIAALVQASHLTIKKIYTDENNWFSVVHLTKSP